MNTYIIYNQHFIQLSTISASNRDAALSAAKVKYPYHIGLMIEPLAGWLD